VTTSRLVKTKDWNLLPFRTEWSGKSLRGEGKKTPRNFTILKSGEATMDDGFGDIFLRSRGFSLGRANGRPVLVRFAAMRNQHLDCLGMDTPWHLFC
jgi:hypothetical protein